MRRGILVLPQRGTFQQVSEGLLVGWAYWSLDERVGAAVGPSHSVEHRLAFREPFYGRKDPGLPGSGSARPESRYLRCKKRAHSRTSERVAPMTGIRKRAHEWPVDFPGRF